MWTYSIPGHEKTHTRWWTMSSSILPCLVYFYAIRGTLLSLKALVRYLCLTQSYQALRTWPRGLLINGSYSHRSVAIDERIGNSTIRLRRRGFRWILHAKIRDFGASKVIFSAGLLEPRSAYTAPCAPPTIIILFRLVIQSRSRL